MKKKYFQVAALVLVLVMVSLAGCATPEAKPGGLELTEQQLEELAERLYPDIKREDTALWGDPLTCKEIIALFAEKGETCIGYATVLEQNYYMEENTSYSIYVKLSIDKVIMGEWKEKSEIITRYAGKYISEYDFWWEVDPNMPPPLKGEKFLLMADPAPEDKIYDYRTSFLFGGIIEEIDGEKYVVYQDGDNLSVMEKLRPFKEDEYTIKEVEIDNGETRKIALVKAEVAEQALVRVIESREFEQWEDGYIDRVTEKLKPLTDFSGDEE